MGEQLLDGAERWWDMAAQFVDGADEAAPGRHSQVVLYTEQRPTPTASTSSVIRTGLHTMTRAISSSVVRPMSTFARPSSRSVCMPCARAR